MACRPAQCSHSRPPGLCDRDHGGDGAGRVLLIDLSRRPIAKKVAADVLTRQPECSNRAIAEQVQLSKGTVQDVRRGLEASGQIGQSETPIIHRPHQPSSPPSAARKQNESETYRSLSEALAAHLPHLRSELVRTDDGTVVARLDADRDGATPVVLSFEALPEPEPEPPPHRDPNRWRHLGDPPGTVFVNRSGHTPTPGGGWIQYPLSTAGNHFAGAPVARQWSISRLDGERLATFGDLPAVLRFLREGGY